MTRMSQPSNYGRFYWCVKVPRDLSKDGEIYLMADDVMFEQGALRFVQRREEAGKSVERVNLLIPAGKWQAVHAASVIDGSAVAVEHWAGEVISPFEHRGNDAKLSPSAAGAKKLKRITKAIRYAVLQRDGFRCQACGRTKGDGVTLEVDHKVPQSTMLSLFCKCPWLA